MNGNDKSCTSKIILSSGCSVKVTQWTNNSKQAKHISIQVMPSQVSFKSHVELPQKLAKLPYLLNIFHHHSLDFRNLSLYFCKFADLFRMIHTVLHMLLQFGPTILTKKIKQILRRNIGRSVMRVRNGNNHPNSLFRPLATAVAAFPPPYLLLKSSLTRSKKAMGICLPADSTATTQQAARLNMERQD